MLSTPDGLPGQKQKWIIITCILIGISLSASFATQVFDLASSVCRLLLGFACILTIGIALSYYLVQRVISPALGKYSPKARLLWISLCLLAGFYFVITIPIMIFPKPQSIRIVATGEKNSASKGSEVWLQSMITGGWASPVHITDCSGDWLLTNTSLVSVKESQPSELVCVVRTDQDIYVQFGTHNWSGIVRVIFEDQVIEEDLYSSDGSSKLIQLKVSLTPFDQFARSLLFIVNGISIGFLLLAALLGLAQVPVTPIKSGDIKPVRWFFYSLPMATAWVIYLLVFWPGFFSPDTLDQFGQIASGIYTDWHPAFHTLVLWLITRLWFSPTPVIITQFIILSGLLGWGLSMMESKGTPKWASWLVALFLAISPAIGLILLNPWKDVAYGIAVLATCLLMFYLIIGDEVNKKIGIGFWILLIIVSSLVALFRHNGWPVAFGTILSLMLIDRRRWKSYLIVLLLSILIWQSVKGQLYTLVQVNQNPTTQSENLNLYYQALYLILAHEQAGTNFSSEEKAILSEFVPVKGVVPPTLVKKYRDELPWMVASVSLRNPFLTFNYFLTRASFIFQILQPSRNRIEHVGLTISSNTYGLLPDSRLPFLQPFFKEFYALSGSPELDWLFWRNALWMYLLGFAGIVAAIRLKTWKYWAVLLPIFLNAGPLAFVSGGQISRYIFPTLLIGPLFGIGLFFLQPILAGQPERGEIDLPGSNESNLQTESMESYLAVK